MRDGNTVRYNLPQPVSSVVSLPMRDGNMRMGVSIKVLGLLLAYL